MAPSPFSKSTFLQAFGQKCDLHADSGMAYLGHLDKLIQ